MSERNFYRDNSVELKRILRRNNELSRAALRSMTPEDLALQNTLDRDVNALVNHLATPWSTVDRLRASGVHTVRDVVVLGPRRLHVSDGPRERTMNGLKNNFPQLYDPRFDDREFTPSPVDTARICHNLGQVAARVLQNFDYTKVSRAHWERRQPEMKPTVLDVLQEDSPLRDIMEIEPSSRPMDAFTPGRAREDALDFARDFLRARAES